MTPKDESDLRAALEATIHQTIVRWSNGDQPKPIKEMVADAVIAVMSATSLEAGEWPPDGTCAICGSCPRSPSTGLCATCEDELSEAPDRDPDYRVVRPAATPPSDHIASPSGEVAAVQIAMGHGKVDVTNIEWQGRRGLLFRPRETVIPVGDGGELQAGEYWPAADDVVIWIDKPEGADVILKHLTPLLSSSTQLSGDTLREAEEIVRDALLDSQYLAGVTAGWNAAQADDPNAALAALHKSRSGHLAGFKEASAYLASATPSPAQQSGEVAWLVERRDLETLPSYCAADPVGGGHMWTGDPLRATRFADRNAAIAWIGAATGLEAVEHVFGLKMPRAAQQSEELREAVVFNCMAWQHDCTNGDWPAEQVRASLKCIDEEHTGDCTGQPWTCMRCCAEEAYRQADQLLVIIASTTPPQSREAELSEVLAAIVEHQDTGRGAPGHCHKVPGIWDRDNPPERAGKPCEWCALWERAQRLASTEAPVSGEGM